MNVYVNVYAPPWHGLSENLEKLLPRISNGTSSFQELLATSKKKPHKFQARFFIFNLEFPLFGKERKIPLQLYSVSD